MNIYLISQNENENYDTYDSAVVVAENEADAKYIHPYFEAEGEWWKNHWRLHEWCVPARVTVRLIGTALPIAARGVVCASYNAG